MTENFRPKSKRVDLSVEDVAALEYDSKHEVMFDLSKWIYWRMPAYQLNCIICGNSVDTHDIVKAMNNVCTHCASTINDISERLYKVLKYGAKQA